MNQHSGACGDPSCNVLHADPSNPIHPPWWKPTDQGSASQHSPAEGYATNKPHRGESVSVEDSAPTFASTSAAHACSRCGQVHGSMPCPMTTAVPTSVPMERSDGSAINMLGVWQMQQRPIDRLARELAFAVCDWLASDTDDDKFEAVITLAAKWRDAVIDA